MYQLLERNRETLQGAVRTIAHQVMFGMAYGRQLDDALDAAMRDAIEAAAAQGSDTRVAIDIESGSIDMATLNVRLLTKSLFETWCARPGVRESAKRADELLLQGMMRVLETEGYPDQLITRFAEAFRATGAIDFEHLEPQATPAPGALARLDAERRERQRQALLRRRAQEKEFRAAQRMMQPFLRSLTEYAMAKVRLQPISKTISGGEILDERRHLPRAFPAGDGLEGRLDLVYSGTDFQLLLNDENTLVLRVCRVSAFTEQVIKRATSGGLYYHGFLLNHSKVAAGTVVTSENFGDVLNWLAQAVAAFEYQPPDVLADAPLEEDACGNRTRVVDLH